MASMIFHFSTQTLVVPPGLSRCSNSLPFEMGTSTAVILYLSHNCILGADNLFSSFTSPEMERNSAPGWIIPRVSLILDDKHDEILSFIADDI